MANASNTNIAAYLAAAAANSSVPLNNIENWPYPGSPSLPPDTIYDALVALFGALPSGSLPAASALAGWQLVATSGKAVALTGGTGKTALATISIPANQLGPNGAVKVKCLWSHTSNGNNKTLSMEFGGTEIKSIVETTGLSSNIDTYFINANATNAQVAPAATALGTGNSANAAATAAKDTTAAVDLVIYGTLANGADTMTLLGYIVEVCYGAAQ